MPDDRSREGDGRDGVGGGGGGDHSKSTKSGQEDSEGLGLRTAGCPPLTAALNWSSPAFASTVDVDAIKVEITRCA